MKKLPVIMVTLGLSLLLVSCDVGIVSPPTNVDVKEVVAEVLCVNKAPTFWQSGDKSGVLIRIAEKNKWIYNDEFSESLRNKPQDEIEIVISETPSERFYHYLSEDGGILIHIESR